MTLNVYSDNNNVNKNDVEYKNNLLLRFPEIEHSYETITHKKVSSQKYNVCMTISLSKKYYLWMTYDNDEDACFLLELTRDKHVSNYSRVFLPTNIHFSFGTVFYGSIPNQDAIFLIEDVFMYKGISMYNFVFGKKLGVIHEFLSFQEKHRTPNQTLICFLPILWEITDGHEEDAIPIDSIPYIIHHIQYRSLTEICPCLNVYITKMGKMPWTVANTSVDEQTARIDPKINIYTQFRSNISKPIYKKNAIFIISADLQYDIYHLFAYGKKKTRVYYDVAYISNYKTSIFMNNIFRRIRENKNIDAIEESDDEEDFQNTRRDKYVDLVKTVSIECCFNYKFRRWIPLCISPSHAHIVNIYDL
jgi:hypothetical protein